MSFLTHLVRLLIGIGGTVAAGIADTAVVAVAVVVIEVVVTAVGGFVVGNDGDVSDVDYVA